MEPAERASASNLQMDSVARQVCTPAANGVIMNNNGANQILQSLREHFTPDAADATYQEVVQSLHFNWAERTMAVFLAEFDVLQRKAESRMHSGGGIPEEFVCFP